MARRYLFGVLACALMLSALGPPGSALSQTTLRLLAQFYVRDGRDTKFPHVDAAGGQVIVAANSGQNDALFWIKGASATTFPAPVRVGTASGQPDFSPVAVDLRPDGAAYLAWIDQPSRQIFFRKRLPNGDLGPTRVVNQGAPFAVAVEIVVATDGAIFVIWRDPNDNDLVRYRRSTDDGASWPIRSQVSDGPVFGVPLGIAAGPNGQVAVTYTAAVNDQLQVFVALYNGTNFQSQRVSNLGADYANSSLSYAPDGRLLVAWRGVTNTGVESSSGFWFSERRSDGSYAVPTRLAGGKLISTANIAVDEGGNQHFSWLAEVSAQPRAYYAYRTAGGTYVGPVEAPPDGASLTEARAAASLAGTAYNHLVTEAFTGNNLYTRYHLFAAPTAMSATPLIENGAALVGNRASVSVGFTLQGQPTQIRWRWGAAPTDTANDSNGYVPFANPLTIPIPDRIRTATSCEPVTLFTQVRDAASGLTEATASQDAISIDSSVTLSVLNVLNPFSAAAANDPPLLAATTAASDGDPQHTRIPSVDIELLGSGDCAGLESLALGKDAANLGPAQGITSNAFDNLVTLPSAGALVRGRNEFIIRVKDKAGNAQDFPAFIFYDDEAPVLNAAAPGTLTLATDPAATLLADLVFSGINVTDQVYPGRGFWGVWIANSRTPVADPVNDPNLAWVALPASGQGNSFIVNNWSLATGLTPSLLTTGDYYVYARFLDGAGNPTSGTLTTTVALTSITRPTLHVPLVRK